MIGKLTVPVSAAVVGLLLESDVTGVSALKLKFLTSVDVRAEAEAVHERSDDTTSRYNGGFSDFHGLLSYWGWAQKFVSPDTKDVIPLSATASDASSSDGGEGGSRASITTATADAVDHELGAAPVSVLEPEVIYSPSPRERAIEMAGCKDVSVTSDYKTRAANAKCERIQRDIAALPDWLLQDILNKKDKSLMGTYHYDLVAALAGHAQRQAQPGVGPVISAPPEVVEAFNKSLRLQRDNMRKIDNPLLGYY